MAPKSKPQQGHFRPPSPSSALPLKKGSLVPMMVKTNHGQPCRCIKHQFSPVFCAAVDSQATQNPKWGRGKKLMRERGRDNKRRVGLTEEDGELLDQFTQRQHGGAPTTRITHCVALCAHKLTCILNELSQKRAFACPLVSAIKETLKSRAFFFKQNWKATKEYKSRRLKNVVHCVSFLV